MKQTRIAAFGITLAISSTALLAAPGDAYTGTYKDEDRMERTPTEATQLRPESTESTMAYEERAEPPRIAYYDPVPEPRDSALEAPVQRTAPYDPRHPQTGQLIERGLFNRTGPNDFGA